MRFFAGARFTMQSSSRIIWRSRRISQSLDLPPPLSHIGPGASAVNKNEHLACLKVLAAIASSTNRNRRQQLEIIIAVERDECGCLEPPDRVQFGGLNPQRTQTIDTPSLACFLQATQQSRVPLA